MCIEVCFSPKQQINALSFLMASNIKESLNFYFSYIFQLNMTQKTIFAAVHLYSGIS